MIPLPLAIAGGIIAALLLSVGAWFGWKKWREVRAHRAQLEAIHAVAYESLRDVIVTDTAGGAMHLDFVLLTARGLLVIDFRDIPGVLFGGEHMNDWTAMTRSRRYTFPNPLPSLFDRVAAVKAVAGDVPVEGRIVFSDRGRFPKGKPAQVVMLDALSQEFPLANRAVPAALGDSWLAAWATLRSQVQPSPLARR